MSNNRNQSLSSDVASLMNIYLFI